MSVSSMLVWSALIGCLVAVGVYWMARLLDASIAGSMATMAGILFVIVLAFAPSRSSGSRRGRA